LNRLLAIAILLWGAACVRAPAQTSPPSAQELLEAVIARLPAEPLRMTGELTVRRRKGIVERQLGFTLAVHWGRDPAMAVYTIRDAFGNTLEQLTLTRPRGQAPGFQYSAGNPLQTRPLPDLFAPIQQSDISWMDLGLSFLWWPGGRITGSDETLGRPCYVVVVPAPPAAVPPGAAARGSAGAGAAYHAVRLWIDREMPMLLRAEGLAADGRVIRRLWVKSVKKINDRWMVKDLEVQQTPSPHRTKLTIHDVEASGAP